jgi:hypothetical protein
MNYNSEYYFYYLTLGLALTGFLSAYLYWKGGEVLASVFATDPNFSRLLNNILLIIFYLLNISYLFMNANPLVKILNGNHLTEKLVYQLGAYLFLLLFELIVSVLAIFFVKKTRNRTSVIEDSPPLRPTLHQEKATQELGIGDD